MIVTKLPVSNHSAIDNGKMLVLQAMMATYQVKHETERGFYLDMIDNVWDAVSIIAQEGKWSTEEMIQFGGVMEQALRLGLADKGIHLD